MDVDQFNDLAPYISKNNTQLRQAISARERLSITLRYLVTGESFSSLSFQYRIGRSTVDVLVKKACRVLHHVLRKDYLKTPTTEDEWREVASGFQNKWQFPHCLGAIDGKHIAILPPSNSGSTFRNYKSHFSVVLMAVVDAHYRFLYANVGTQGQVSDGGVYAHSDLKQAMDSTLLNVPSAQSLPGTDVVMPFMFVADEAFPLHTHLMKPYSFRDLDHEQRIYNYRLSRASRVVENAFGILANRWQVFLKAIPVDPEAVSWITLAALSLHNYLRAQATDTYIPPALVDIEDEDHHITPGSWCSDTTLQSVLTGRDRNTTRTAKEQRDRLKDYFSSPAAFGF